MEKKSGLRQMFGELMNTDSSVNGSAARELSNDDYNAAANDSNGSDNKIYQLKTDVRPCAVLTEDVVINGSLHSKNDVVMAGRVNGNVDVEGKLTVRGKIEGDIVAGEIRMEGARVMGKMTCKGRLDIDVNSVSVGNIEAEELILDGKVQGDALVKGETSIRSQALLMGDLDTGSVSIDRGATFMGKIKTKTSENLSQAFNDFK
ncbi:MAG: polymer-forming cytoskeletal protein [Oscillospiraceae bacterium]|nr:polymer-forming cytoskeletal protein [Oscillospiraceae bacterium]